MNKRELDILEKAFSAQIRGGIYQGKCKVTKKLADEGYLIERKFTLGGAGLIPIRVEGYDLTFAGNFAYCSSERCSDEAIAKLEAEVGK